MRNISLLLRLVVTIFVVMLPLSGCGLSQPKVSEKIERSKLIGTWSTKKWELYHTLTFQEDSTVAIDNHVDTIYRFKFNVEEDELILTNGKENFKSTIKMMTDDSLALNRLPDKKDEQIYVRVAK